MRKSKIIKGLHKEQSILEIAKSIGHDRRTVKTSAINPVSCRGRSVRKNRGRIACVISIMREFRCNPLQTNKEVLQGAWISDLPKRTQYRILKNIENLDIRPSLKDVHIMRRLEWAKKYMKQNFNHVLFTNEFRATVGRPDAWRRRWYSMEGQRPHLYLGAVAETRGAIVPPPPPPPPF